MKHRFTVRMKNQDIGTVWLDPRNRGAVTAELDPLPAFASLVSHYRATLEVERQGGKEPFLSGAKLAALDGARALANSLKLSLVLDRDGTEVHTQTIELLHGEPPVLKIHW